jgi:hypothetical protein
MLGEAGHRGDASYLVLWNAFKRIASDEKTALGSGAAAKAYRPRV